MKRKYIRQSKPTNRYSATYYVSARDFEYLQTILANPSESPEKLKELFKGSKTHLIPITKTYTESELKEKFLHSET